MYVRGYECFSTELSLFCKTRIISNIEHELKLLWTFIYFVYNDKNISPLLEIGSFRTNTHLDFIELGKLLRKDPLNVPNSRNFLGNSDFMLNIL